MHMIAKTCAALFALTALAHAADDPYADLYGNTLVYTSAKNIVTRVFVSKDGTWTSTSNDPKNATDSGQWVTVGGWLCITDAAMPGAPPACQKAIAHRVGEKWSEPDSDKTMLQATVVRGR